MKLTFATPTDNQVHMYCMHCGAESVTYDRHQEAAQSYYCANCRGHASRALVIDPAIAWWRDAQGEYWHETAGVFVERDGKFLFFDRVKHPLGLTVPAGHVDRGEQSKVAAMRELREETTLKTTRLSFVAQSDIKGDECRRGADIHRWHVFAMSLANGQEPKIDANEGAKAVWLTLEEALRRQPTFAVRSVIQQFAGHIRRAVG